ncbi:hypothetical protein L4C54_06730 [Vibrio lamellibrachiae]|uniref:hypothetical protein n=1 Tax=Vibrio lamellibrachiae TaxID=2910253 RepID=UPI003D146BD1
MKWITWSAAVACLWVSAINASYLPDNDIDLHLQTVNNISTNSISAWITEYESPFYHFNANSIGGLSAYRLVSAVYEGDNFEECYSNSPIQIPIYQESLTPIGDKEFIIDGLTKDTSYCLITFITYSFQNNDGTKNETTTGYVNVLHTQAYERIEVGRIASLEESLIQPETFIIKIESPTKNTEEFQCRVDNPLWYSHYQWPSILAQCINNNSHIVEAGQLSASGHIEPVTSSHLNVIWSKNSDLTISLERVNSTYAYTVNH